MLETGNEHDGEMIFDKEEEKRIMEEMEAEKIKAEKLNAIAEDIRKTVNELGKKHNTQFFVAGIVDYEGKGELGFWFSEGMTTLEKKGFARTIDEQF